MTYPVQPLKHMALVAVSNVDKKSADEELPVRLVNYTDVYYGDRITPELPLMLATATPAQVRAFRVRSGDVLITKDSEAADDIGIPAFVDASSADMVLGYHLAMLRPVISSVHPRYLYWAMASDRLRGQLSAGATGVTRFGLRTDVIASAAVPYPRLGEQGLIADFLDTETARIDALITKKRRMIELLGERDGARIEEVLCAAADREISLRRLLVGLPRYGAAEAGTTGADEWPRYIRITDLTEAGLLRADGILRLPPDIATPFLLEDGDLLLARSGATVGKAFLYRGLMGSAAFAGYLIRFRADQRKILPELIEAWTRTRHYWSQVRLASLQATIENVSAEKYKDFSVPLVPRSRQGAVLVGVNAVRENNRLARGALIRQIALLQEHRQALITAAVTGDLDVPGAAA